MKLLVCLLALLFVAHSVCLASAKTERYVRSNTSTTCPVKPCLTLNEYANEYFTSDTSFVFLDGEHYLDSALWVQNKTNISMRGTNVNVTIVLLSNAYFKFTESQEFVLNSLIIRFHGFHSDEGLRFSSALIIENCQSFALSNLKFSRYPGTEGLSRAIILQQSTVNITNSSVSNCNNTQGSAIYVSWSTINFFGSNYFSRNQVVIEGTLFVFSSRVLFNGSTIFDENEGFGTPDYRVQGGAIRMENSTVVIQGTANFTENSIAEYGYGGAVSVHNSNLYINATVIFFNNSAESAGGAIYAEVSYVQLAGDVTFENNRAVIGGAIHMVGAISAHSSNLYINATVIFFKNSAVEFGGAIYIVGSSVLITGNISFVSNRAIGGGAMGLDGSAQLLLRSPLVASFYDNKAAGYGGAIYNADSASVCSDFQPDCFFAEDTDSDQRELYLNFSKNSAYQGGSVIYGGNLEHCLVNHTTSGISFLQNVSNIISSEISSDPLKICICENETISDCTFSLEMKKKRGELFTISLITVGQLNLSVSSKISAKSDINVDGSVQLAPQFPFSDSTCTNVSITLFANEFIRRSALQFYPDGLCGNTNATRISIEINLEDCPPGFHLVMDRCDCERRLSELIDKEKDKKKTCDIDSGTILRPGNAWMQPIWDKNHSKYRGFIWHPDCPLGYCKSANHSIQLNFSNLSTSDSLCTETRNGMLCGACRQNYSLTLGNYTCKMCENKSLSLLLFFAVSGIALIAVLLLLRITVATGTINGLILYANIVSVNRDIFFPPDMVNINVYPLTVFLAWLNLDFGVSTCFYDGLDAYVYAWLQYLFPIYLWCLIGAIIVINKLPIRIGGLFGSNPVAVLATVIMMSYTKLLQSSIVALTYTQLDYQLDHPDNHTITVWLYNGTVTYFEGRHLYLAVAAILVIAFLILPYIFLLTFGYRLLAYSNRRYCSWFNTFKPFLDPYYAPFNGKTRYWSGFLLVIRGGLYVGFTVGNPNDNLVAISVTFFVLAALPWLGHRVYEKLYLNILEVSFILNVCVLSIFTYYVRSIEGSLTGLSDEGLKLQAIVTYLSLGLAFVEFLGIVLFHLYLCIKKRGNCERRLVRWRAMRGGGQNQHAPPVEQGRPLLDSNAHFREPLLEDEDY